MVDWLISSVVLSIKVAGFPYCTKVHSLCELTSALRYIAGAPAQMDDVENDDIAAAMGFSSFGGTKKRKYDQTNSPKSKADASGANTTRLGMRPQADHGSNNLPATGDDASGLETSNSVAESQETPAQDKPKQKQKQKQKQPAATGLAAFLSRGQDLPERPAQGEQANVVVPRDTSDANLMVSFGGPPIPKAEVAALRNGVLDENGDRAYFLPSFVEDPWERFSKESI